MKRDRARRLKLYKWLLIGLIIRFLFMPFTVHDDLVAAYWRSHFLANHGVLNLNAYLTRYGISLGQAPSHYLLGGYLLLIKPLMPYSEEIWPHTGNLVVIVAESPEAFSKEWFEWLAHPNLYRTLFLLKFPYLLFDLASGFLLLKLLEGEKRKEKSDLGLRAFQFWMINPVGIFAAYIWGRFDYLTIFFILLSLWYAKKGKIGISGLSLGIAAATRYYPLILLPFYVIILGRDWREKLKVGIWGIVPLGISSLVNVASAGGMSDLKVMATMTHGDYFLSMDFWVGDPTWNIDIYIYTFIVIYTFIALYSYFKSERNFIELSRYSLIILLIYLAISYFHPHYLIWITPFLALEIAQDREFTTLHIAQLIGFLVYTFYLGSSNWHLFSPLDPEFFYNLPNPEAAVSLFYPWTKFLSIFRSFFSGVCLWMAYMVYIKLSHKPKEV